MSRENVVTTPRLVPWWAILTAAAVAVASAGFLAVVLLVGVR